MKIQANANNILRLLKDAFTSRDTYIKELLQNANRAGATTFKHYFTRSEDNKITLTVTDNGSGIADMSKLLDIGVSGWDAETTANVAPYGVGFLSAVFACERFEVHSNGQVLSAVTDELVAGGSAEIGPSEVTSGTMVVLHGLKQERYFANDVNELYIGLPFNGGGWCTHGLSVDIPDLGKLIYIGDRQNRDRVNLNVALFLQGFNIAHHSRAISARTDLSCANFVLHLDPTKFFGRMPDRDCLLNCENVEFEKLIREHAIDIVKAIPIKDDKAYRMAQAYAPERIKDHPVLRGAFKPSEEWSDSYRLEYNDERETYTDDPLTLSKDAYEEVVEAGGVVLVTDWDDNPDSSEGRLLLRGVHLLNLQENTIVANPASHVVPDWVPERRRVEARVIEAHNATVAGGWTLCSHVTVGLYDEGTDELIWQWGESEWCFADGNDSYLIGTTTIPDYWYQQDGRAVKEDYDGEWDWDWINEQQTRDQQNLDLALGGDISRLVAAELDWDKRLAGQTFTVTYDAQGKPTVVHNK